MNWKFNLGRAPWWSGQFERMIGLMKQMLYKVMGNAHLTMVEMQEAMLYIEINMSNWSLTYLVDNIEQPILTPKSLLLHGQIINVPDIQLESNPITNIKSNNPDIRKRIRKRQRSASSKITCRCKKLLRIANTTSLSTQTD